MEIICKPLIFYGDICTVLLGLGGFPFLVLCTVSDFELMSFSRECVE